MIDTLVTISGVSKIYNNIKTVNNINLDIKKGEIVALCGGNGAGKSTLLRMIVGTILPSQGSIYVNNLNFYENRREYAKTIGYMPDDFQFSQSLTAFETLFYWAKLREIDKSRVSEVLNEVGLLDDSNKQANSFSKGMKQRLMFAQAIISKPSLLVMDEPTNGLDPYWMQTFVQMVKDLKKNEQTVMFSTHQLHIAEALADRIIFLNHGEIILDGYINELKAEHGQEGLNKLFAKIFGL